MTTLHTPVCLYLYTHVHLYTLYIHMSQLVQRQLYTHLSQHAHHTPYYDTHVYTHWEWLWRVCVASGIARRSSWGCRNNRPPPSSVHLRPVQSQHGEGEGARETRVHLWWNTRLICMCMYCICICIVLLLSCPRIVYRVHWGVWSRFSQGSSSYGILHCPSVPVSALSLSLHLQHYTCTNTYVS